MNDVTYVLPRDRAGVLARLRDEADLDFGPAVLDPAHVGDIQGSLGTISLRDRAPRAPGGGG
jgi:hypothetical protein